MKVTKAKEEMRQLGSEQLGELLGVLRKKLFTLRVNAATAHVKDYSEFQKLRRGIARVLTEMRMRDSKQDLDTVTHRSGADDV